MQGPKYKECYYGLRARVSILNASIPIIQHACGTVAKETELALEQILSVGNGLTPSPLILPLNTGLSSTEALRWHH
jgi:hypothetical protein